MKATNKSHVFTLEDVKHVAKLAKLDLTPEEEVTLAPQIAAILDFVSQLQKVPTANIAVTRQVTGLTNIYRPDEIDATRMLTQEQALQNAPATYNGMVKVPAIFEE